MKLLNLLNVTEIVLAYYMTSHGDKLSLLLLIRPILHLPHASLPYYSRNFKENVAIKLRCSIRLR